MSNEFEEDELTPEEQVQAREHWDALMFAPSRDALEKAQLALLEAPIAVRRAVTTSITEFWLRDYEPHRDENPF